jgi:FkbM family methyltransferase
VLTWEQVNILQCFLEKASRRWFQQATSFSQEGEDLILRRVFEGRNSGFYVDIGAHDPRRFSNTYLFYRSGWRGINVDPLIGESNRFAKIRPNDLNLAFGVSTTEGSLEYHKFDEPALNTFSSTQRDQVLKTSPKYRLIESKLVTTLPLHQLLDRYLPAGQSIDFLSVDVEGLDFEVLNSNDWTKFRPTFVLYEDHKSKIQNESFNLGQEPALYFRIEGKIAEYLARQGYGFFAKTLCTWIFRRID